MEPYAPRPDAAMATTAPSRLRRLTLDVLDTYTRVGAGRPAGAGGAGGADPARFAEWIRLSTTPRAPGRPSVVPRRSLTAPNVGGGNEGRDNILSALVCLDDAKIVHCDVKPENILLSPRPGDDGASVVKLIDFGSACVEGRSTQTYVQSRFYRAPEVLVGAPYDGAIDVWSAACVVAELMLGLPVFPGVSAHNQITRIVEMLGTFPDALLERGDDAATAAGGRARRRCSTTTAPTPSSPTTTTGPLSYELKTPEAYARDTGSSVPRTKKYFQYKRLDEIVNHYPIRAGLSASDVDAERDKRKVFAHFVRGMLRHAPDERWTPRMAAAHPFLAGAALGNWQAPRDPRDERRHCAGRRPGGRRRETLGASAPAWLPDDGAPTPRSATAARSATTARTAPSPARAAAARRPGAYYYPPPQYSPDAAFAPLRRNNTMTEAQWRDAAARQAGASSYGAQGAFSYTAGYPGAGVARSAGALGETDFSFALQRPTAGPSFHPRAPRSPASDDGQPPGEYYGSAPGYGGGNSAPGGAGAPGPFPSGYAGRFRQTQYAYAPQHAFANAPHHHGHRRSWNQQPPLSTTPEDDRRGRRAQSDPQAPLPHSYQPQQQHRGGRR
ncbi:protein kinase [Aureococcus anophagefferens]|nr:protein kinase [Aureococcus anophagefferens]